MYSAIFFSSSRFENIRHKVKPSYHEFKYEGLKCICFKDIDQDSWQGYIEICDSLIKTKKKHKDLSDASKDLKDKIDQFKLKISSLID